MNHAQLLAHFGRVSEAPDAIPRLRRFILSLAVRGRLVEQDQRDEPVSKLLKRIQVEKARLMGERKIREQGPLPAIDERLVPFSVPSHWTWLRLSELGILSGGMTPSKNRPEFWGGKINWFSPKDIKSDELVESELKITSSGIAETGLQLYQPGCLFMVARSGILKRTFPVAINRVEATANQDLKVLAPFIGGLDRYLQIMFRGMTDFILSTLVKTGTTVQSLKYEEFELLPIPFPPFDEQQRIVAKVDELMVLCDQLEAAQAEREIRRDRLVVASLERLGQPTIANMAAFREHARFFLSHLPCFTIRPEQIPQLRQTILNLAIRGKLVSQDPNDEPASELLKCIQGEKARLIKAGTLRKEKPLPLVAKDEEPFAIPESWRWARIGACSLLTEYGTSVKSDHTEDGVPVLKMGDIQGGQVILGGQKKVSRAIAGLPQLFLKKNDLLYNRTNSAELVGKTGIYLGEDDAYTFASYLIRIRFIESLTNPIYINLAMNASYFRETQILPEVQQQCGQANVNGSKLRNMIVPFPPLAEQHRIVVRAEELLALCDRLEAQLITVQTESRRLLESVLHEALTVI